MIRKIAVRDVNEHGLIMFMSSLLINEARPNTLDLDTSTCFLLYVFHEHSL